MYVHVGGVELQRGGGGGRGGPQAPPTPQNMEFSHFLPDLAYI